MSERITISPDICNGKPVVRGTRISVQTVLEFLAAGATAIQVGTANFVEPGVSQRLVEELEQYCLGRGIAAASLVGRAHRTGPAPADAGAEG